MRLLRTVSSPTVVASVGCAIALASAGVTYAMYRDTQRYNSFQMSQGDPVIMYEGFHTDLHDGESFKQTSSTTSKLCNRYYFTLSTANDHPISNVTIHSTVLEFPSDTTTTGYSFKDEFGDRVFAKSSHFSTAPTMVCFYLESEDNATFQGGSVYWHATVDLTDSLTHKTFTKDLYQVAWMEYNKSEDDFESKTYLLTAKQFNEESKDATIKELQ